MTKKKTLLMLCAFVFGTAVFSSCNNGGETKETPKDSAVAKKDSVPAPKDSAALKGTVPAPGMDKANDKPIVTPP